MELSTSAMWESLGHHKKVIFTPDFSEKLRGVSSLLKSRSNWNGMRQPDLFYDEYDDHYSNCSQRDG